MQEQSKQQPIPLKVYRADQRLMIAAPMPGLEPENIVADGNLSLHGDLRGRLKEVKELLLDEWSALVYHHELALTTPVNAECANVTYGNGVLMVTLPRSRTDTSCTPRAQARDADTWSNAGHPPACLQA